MPGREEREVTMPESARPPEGRVTAEMVAAFVNTAWSEKERGFDRDVGPDGGIARGLTAALAVGPLSSRVRELEMALKLAYSCLLEVRRDFDAPINNVIANTKAALSSSGGDSR